MLFGETGTRPLSDVSPRSYAPRELHRFVLYSGIPKTLSLRSYAMRDDVNSVLTFQKRLPESILPNEISCSMWYMFSKTPLAPNRNAKQGFGRRAGGGLDVRLQGFCGGGHFLILFTVSYFVTDHK